MAFWRRSKGRHALGAAVTSLPAAPRPPAPLPAAATFVPPAPEPSAPVPPVAPAFVQSAPESPAAPSVAPALDWSFPELAAPIPAPPPGPRVELTFADGSSASLDPVQARALDEIAQVLTRRDG